MPAKDLGTKHVCFKCGTKFYDLKKPVPLCPKCGADQRESPALRSPTPERKRARPPEPKPAPPEVEVEPEADDDADLEDDADEAEDDDS